MTERLTRLVVHLKNHVGLLLALLLIDLVFANEKKRRTDKHSLYGFFHCCVAAFLFGRSELNNLGDPVSELGYSGVDPGLVFLCTANTPGYDPGEHEPVVWPPDGHGSTAIALNSTESLGGHGSAAIALISTESLGGHGSTAVALNSTESLGGHGSAAVALNSTESLGGYGSAAIVLNSTESLGGHGSAAVALNRTESCGGHDS